MENIFEVFDENIGLDGYYKIIREKLFPKSTSQSIDITSLNLERRIFRKGAIFSRVRKISVEKKNTFISGKVAKDDFYPPKPYSVDIPAGRFNLAGMRTLYLADHPLIAMEECEVSQGDYFLLANIKISTDMSFIFVNPGRDDLSNSIYQLTQSKDKKFYPVINRINDEILSFAGYHGIAYTSTKIEPGYVDETWGDIGTTMNLAVAGKYIKDTTLAAAWLYFCGEKRTVFQHSLFKPLSEKKKNKLTRINIVDGRSAFIRESKKIMDNLKMESEKTRRLLDGGNYSELNQSPVKIVWK